MVFDIHGPEDSTKLPTGQILLLDSVEGCWVLASLIGFELDFSKAASPPVNETRTLDLGIHTTSLLLPNYVGTMSILVGLLTAALYQRCRGGSEDGGG